MLNYYFALRNTRGTIECEPFNTTTLIVIEKMTQKGNKMRRNVRVPQYISETKTSWHTIDMKLGPIKVQKVADAKVRNDPIQSNRVMECFIAPECWNSFKKTFAKT